MVSIHSIDRWAKGTIDERGNVRNINAFVAVENDNMRFHLPQTKLLASIRINAEFQGHLSYMLLLCTALTETVFQTTI